MVPIQRCCGLRLSTYYLAAGSSSTTSKQNVSLAHATNAYIRTDTPVIPLLLNHFPKVSGYLFPPDSNPSLASSLHSGHNLIYMHVSTKPPSIN